jgi:hypothetical protein
MDPARPRICPYPPWLIFWSNRREWYRREANRLLLVRLNAESDAQTREDMRAYFAAMTKLGKEPTREGFVPWLHEERRRRPSDRISN